MLADQSPPVPRGRDQLSSHRSWRLGPQREAHGRQDHNSQDASRQQHRPQLAGSFTLTGQLHGGRETNASYRKTSNIAEEAGASSLLTLSSENLALKGRAEPEAACRGQYGGRPEGAAASRRAATVTHQTSRRVLRRRRGRGRGRGLASLWSSS